ncbi:PHA/PHB synthase family protein [Roseobacter sp. GAI101]|uniref:PHA/PHB synthase family protein n=1 Tax=Roseobacter sp. (strain GAI101) TaxID=391589 RepID=UPI000187256C|nr:alpha/beta fold hydrolase [Roseobacter sp. GAI101]EEB86349.1 poly(3-hydroxyalkanoate) polymerase [Roseobacter sp. GAI101]
MLNDPKLIPFAAKGRNVQAKAKSIVPKPHDIPPEDAYEKLDRIAHASVATATSGLAPSVLAEAWMDWAVHLAVSPGKQMHLAEQAIRNSRAIWAACLGHAVPETPDDRRFASEGWQKYPFNVWAHAHQTGWQWWQDAMTNVHGVAPAHEDLLAFTAGLVIDTTAPSNFALTNPDVISATFSEKGENLICGAKNLFDDIARKTGIAHPSGPHPFEVGRNLATSPGKVVFRNKLIELIQYAPTTARVRPEPILIVPAWIMKYYILDLSAHNSLVAFLVAQGFTVFMISWKNPEASDRNLSMEDYRELGVMAAIDAALSITQAAQLHAVGYCLGGTLLSIAAAAMGAKNDDRLASATFLAAQVDFTEAGPLRLFINDSQVTLIEDMMAQEGFLSTDQMAGTFALLRARDLIWAPAIRDYLLGHRGTSSDLMAWNADATRMPAKMHSEYLRKLFLNNDLTEGRYHVGKDAIAIADIRAPIFAVGTEDDHVAPWQSVYKLHLFADTGVTFVLTNGGHNAGIVSEPGHPGRHFRIGRTPANAAYRDPDDWLALHAPKDGSWWTPFADWLAERSGKPQAPPPLGAHSGACKAMCAAPGTYVMQP